MNYEIPQGIEEKGRLLTDDDIIREGDLLWWNPTSKTGWTTIDKGSVYIGLKPVEALAGWEYTQKDRLRRIESV